MLSRDIFGLPIPDAGPLFAAALVVHIAAGLTAVIAGALAATATKRPGRHPKAGRAYLTPWPPSSLRRPSWRRSAGARTPTCSRSPASHSGLAYSAGGPGGGSGPAGRPATRSGWAAPTSPC